MTDIWTAGGGNDGNYDGSYQTASNWSDNVPAGDVAVFPDYGTPYTVIITNNPIGSFFTIEGWSTAANVTLEVTAGGDFASDGADIVNNGTLLTIGANSSVDLSSSYVYNYGLIQADSGTSISIQPGVAFVNSGTVDLTGPDAQLDIDGYNFGPGVTNDGTIEATGSGSFPGNGLEIIGNVTNNGTIAVNGPGTSVTIGAGYLNNSTSVSGTGKLVIGGGGTMTVLAPVSCNVAFAAGGGTLEFYTQSPIEITGTISGLAAGDAIAFVLNGSGYSFTGYTLNGDELTALIGPNSYNFTLAAPLPAGDALSMQGDEIVVTGPAAVADTAANISANLDSYKANLPPSITVTDNKPLTVTVGQITADAAALAVTTNENGSPYSLNVVDTAANVSARFDTLNGDSHVASIALTDSGTPVLSLTVAQALDDTTALGEIASPHTITVADTGADVSALTAAQIAALAAEGVTSIVVADGVVEHYPFGFELNASQAVALAVAGIHISNPNSYAYYPVIVLDSQANIQALTPAQITALGSDGVSEIESSEPLVWTVAQTDALIAAGVSGGAAVPVVIADTAANIETMAPAQFNLLRNTLGVTSITATDGSVSLNVAQALAIEQVNDQSGLTIHAPAGDSVTLADTAASIAALTPSQIAGLAAEGVTAVTVSDTAAQVAANLDALQTLAAAGDLSSIALTDGGTPALTITASQLTNDATALGDITSPYQLAVSGVSAANAASVAAIPHVASVAVSDMAASVAANLDALQTLAARGELSSITLTDGGTPTLSITASQLTSDATALSEITSPYQLAVTGVAAASAATVAATPHVVSTAVSDTAVKVAANFDALQTLVARGELSSISLTDGGRPALNLTVAQALNDTTALGEIVAPHTIMVSDTGADVSALTLAQIAALAAEGVTSIVVTDGVVEHSPFGLELSAAQAVALTAGGIHISNPNSSAYYPVIVLDSQANVQALTPAQIAPLGSDGFSVIAAYGALVWTVAQTDALLSAGLSSGTYGAGAVPVALKDTAANIETLTPTQIAAGRTQEGITSFTATSGSLIFDVAQALQIEQNGITVAAPARDSVTLADTAANIAALTAAQIAGLAAEGITAVTVSDTAAHVAANLDALQTLAAAGDLSSIALIDGGSPKLTITVSQLINDPTALGDITSPYQLAVTGVSAANATSIAASPNVTSVAVSDMAANVAANLDALQVLAATGELSSVALTDSGTPTLTLSIAEALNDTAALGKIASPHKLALADTASNIASLSSANAAMLKADGYTSIASTTGPVTMTVAEAQLLVADGIAVTGGALTATDSIAAMLALSVGAASTLVGTGYALTVLDTAADIQKLTSAQVSGVQARHVARIEASDTSVGLTVALTTLLEGSTTTPAIPVATLSGSVTVTDTSANLGKMSAGFIEGLPGLGVSSIVSSNGAVTVDAAQAEALEAAGLKIAKPGGAAVTVTLSDSPADLFGASGLSLAQIAALPSIGVTGITASASVAVSVAQALALEGAKLKLTATGGTVTLSDSPANIATLAGGTAGTIALLAGTGVSGLAATGNLTLSVSQADAFEKAKLGISLPSGDTTYIVDSLAQIETLTAAQISGLSTLGVSQVVDITEPLNPTLTVAQAEALETADIGFSDPYRPQVLIADTAANLQGMLSNLSSAQLSDLFTLLGVHFLQASGNVSYTAAETTALMNADLGILETGSYTATENFANDDYWTFQDDNLIQQKSVNPDGTYDIAHYGVTGKPYSSYEDIYNTGGKVAEAQDVSSGLGNVILYANALTVSQASGSENITTGTDTFAVTPHATETTTATGRSNETFVFASGFGTDTLVGFLATSANHDLVQLSPSMFAAGSTVTSILNGATGTSSPTITDSAGDTLTFSGVNKSTLLANTGDFKLV